MSQFIGLNLQIWEAGGLASFQTSSLAWTGQSMVNEILAFYGEGAETKKRGDEVFKVRLSSSAPQPEVPSSPRCESGLQSREPQIHWLYPTRGTWARDPSRASVFAVSGGNSAGSAQTRPLLAAAHRASARRPCAFSRRWDVTMCALAAELMWSEAPWRRAAQLARTPTFSSVLVREGLQTSDQLPMWALRLSPTHVICTETKSTVGSQANL